MNTKTQRNPFTPGPGITPPILAGRSTEQSILKEHLDMLCSPDGPHAPRHMLISGPRGVGKTVLLNWLEEEFAKSFSNGVVISTQANKIRDITEIVGVLDKDVIDKSTLHGWHAGGSIITGSGEYGKTPVPHVVTPPWAHLLEQSLLSKHTASDESNTATGIAPLLVTIDEAHNLSDDAVVTVANLAQAFSRARAQACFFLAGTPVLFKRLVSSGPKHPSTGETETATFVERCDKIYPGLLDREASREALLTPFQDNNWRVDKAVMDKILDDAQGYPWFLQLWGRELWVKGADRREITWPVMEAAREKVDRERTTIYQARLDELNAPLSDDIGGRQVLLAVRAVAERLLSRSNAPLSETELEQILIDLEEAGISFNEHKSLKMRFLHTGLLVEDPASEQMRWQIGIPSLANYIVKSTSHLAPAVKRSVVPEFTN